jgi:hypothetical protein
MALHVRSDLASSLGRAAHDLGMAGLLGGNLFGRLALHPAVHEIADKRDRGRVVNAAWRRYGTVNSLSTAAVVAGWAGARAGEARPRNLSGRERVLASAKDGAVAAVVATGLASAAVGVRFARSAPGGAVPLEDGSTPAPEASSEAARAKRALNVLGAANLASEVALVTVNAALGQANFRRPPARRLLRRRY